MFNVKMFNVKMPSIKILGVNMFKTKTLTSKKSKLFTGLFLWLCLVSFAFVLPFIPQAVNQKIDSSFLDSHGNSTALVFFGFTGCSDVCPMTLSIIKQVFNGQRNHALWPQVVFVDIDSHSNDHQAVSYAKQFHQAFVGTHIPLENLDKISAQFGLNSQQQNNSIVHVGKTYLLQRELTQWRLVKVFSPNSLSVALLHQELF